MNTLANTPKQKDKKDKKDKKVKLGPKKRKKLENELREHNYKVLTSNNTNDDADLALIAAEITSKAKGPIRWENVPPPLCKETTKTSEAENGISPFNEKKTQEIEAAIKQDRKRQFDKVVAKALWPVFRELSHYPLKEVATSIAEMAEESAIGFAHDQKRKLDKLIVETNDRIAAYTTA